MTTRRQVALALGLGAFAAPLASFAQQPAKVFRVGLLQLGSASSGANRLKALRAGLRDLGYVEGKNLVIDSRWGEGKYDRLPKLAAELVQLKVDVIVTSAAPVVVVAKRATSTIPIVMAATGDPVGGGLADSLARPGGNVTGLTLMSTELVGKWLQIVRELSPGASRAAVLALATASGTPASGTRLLVEELRPMARKMNIQLVVAMLTEAADVPNAFAVMQRERTQALIVQVNPISFDHRAQIVELAAKQRLVAIYEGSDFADAGGLISYGPNQEEMWRRAATYVDKILKGAKPGDLPIEQPSRFELVVNLKSARALGLTIPQSVLIRADRIIE